jgi:multidrug resistance efflux pump
MARRLRTDCDDLTPGEAIQALTECWLQKWRAIAERRFEVSESERHQLSEWTIALCGAGKEIFEWMGEIWLEMAAKWDRMAELAELNLSGESTIASCEEAVHIASVQIPALQAELKQAMEWMDDASARAKTMLDKREAARDEEL